MGGSGIRSLVAALSLLVGVVGNGCAILDPGATNLRVATWAIARAEVDLHPIPNRSHGAYTRLWIFLDRVGRPLLVRLPDGSVVSTSELTPARIWSYTFEGRMGQACGFGCDRGERRLTVLFDCSFWTSGGSMAFTFRDNRLMILELGGDDATLPGSCRPAFGEADGGDLLVMPVPEQALVKMFGPCLERKDVWAGL